MSWSVGKIGKLAPAPEQRTTIAYVGLYILSVLYFLRPEDFIPGLAYIPTAKIAGGIALVALIFGVTGKRDGSFPKEFRVLLMMYGWLCIDILFSSWKAGSLRFVFTDYLKAPIVALLVGLVVQSVTELRRLIFVQALFVTLNGVTSLFLGQKDFSGRLGGMGNGALSNPNDLAINIALNWPICAMFFFSAKNPIAKALWGIALIAMVRTVMLTYSRSGFLALGVAVFMVLVEFGIRGRRRWLLAAPIVLAVPIALLAPSNYGLRLESIVGTPQAGSMDRGSAEARKELLIKSVEISLTHPLFGVGPGCFPSYTNEWLVTHNTYTELSSESGIPALILFLVIMRLSFTNLRKVRERARAEGDHELQFYASSLWAGLAAYMVGAFFACTARELFPYFMIGYTTALFRITQRKLGSEVVVVEEPANKKAVGYGQGRRLARGWSR